MNFVVIYGDDAWETFSDDALETFESENTSMLGELYRGHILGALYNIEHVVLGLFGIDLSMYTLASYTYDRFVTMYYRHKVDSLTSNELISVDDCIITFADIGSRGSHKILQDPNFMPHRDHILGALCVDHILEKESLTKIATQIQEFRDHVSGVSCVDHIRFKFLQRFFFENESHEFDTEIVDDIFEMETLMQVATQHLRKLMNCYFKQEINDLVANNEIISVDGCTIRLTGIGTCERYDIGYLKDLYICHRYGPKNVIITEECLKMKLERINEHFPDKESLIQIAAQIQELNMYNPMQLYFLSIKYYPTPVNKMFGIPEGKVFGDDFYKMTTKYETMLGIKACSALGFSWAKLQGNGAQMLERLDNTILADMGVRRRYKIRQDPNFMARFRDNTLHRLGDIKFVSTTDGKQYGPHVPSEIVAAVLTHILYDEEWLKRVHDDGYSCDDEPYCEID